MDWNLGIDFGNVIIDHLGFGTTEDYFHHGDYNLIPPVENALECLAELNRTGLFKNITVVYNATGVADMKISNWLIAHRFCEITGIPAANIFRSTHGRNKLIYCQQHGITHFVDDRMEVLNPMIGIIPFLFLLNGQAQEIAGYQTELNKLNVADSWSTIISTIQNQQLLK